MKSMLLQDMSQTNRKKATALYEVGLEMDTLIPLGAYTDGLKKVGKIAEVELKAASQMSNNLFSEVWKLEKKSNLLDKAAAGVLLTTTTAIKVANAASTEEVIGELAKPVADYANNKVVSRFVPWGIVGKTTTSVAFGIGKDLVIDSIVNGVSK